MQNTHDSKSALMVFAVATNACPWMWSYWLLLAVFYRRNYCSVPQITLHIIPCSFSLGAGWIRA